MWPVHTCVHAGCGFVFRDLRWSNTARHPTEPRWFLLDLEACVKEGGRPGSTCGTCWDNDTLVSGCFTYASDLHLLGKVLSDHASCVGSEDGRAFLCALSKPAPSLTAVTACSLLGHEWLKCEGMHCVAAGAQPREF